MNNDIRKRWIAALTHGRYTQCAHKLRKVEDGKETFCALGVLCNLYIEENDDARWDPHFPGLVAYEEDDSETKFADGELPYTVRDWADLESISGPFFTVGKAKRILPDKTPEFWATTIDGIATSKYITHNQNDMLINIPRLNDAGATFEDIALVLKNVP